MGTYTQDDRPLKVTTPLGKDVLLLQGFTGSEGISQLFRFQLDMLAEKQADVAFDKLLGQKLTIEVALPGSKKRHLNGVCNRIGQGERVQFGDKGEWLTTYRAEIVPQVWLLTRKAQSRIFQHLSVPDILQKVFKGLEVKYDLMGVFHPRDFCVQYRETDFNFASRLMEEEGIYYFFKHSDGSHEMVVANTPQSHPDFPPKSNLTFETVEGGVRTEDRVHYWEKVQELRSGKVTLWDHSFELPHKHLETEKTIQDSVAAGKVTHKLKVGGNDKLEIYDWPGEYAQRFDGVDRGGGEQPAELQKIFVDNKRTVEIRMQEEAAPSLVIRGGSKCRQVVSGHKFTLEKHFNGDGAYLVTACSISARGSGEYRPGHTGDFDFENTFTCIPLAIPFRPPRTTPKPVVQGTQSAVVVGPPGEEIFTDKYSRVKVQFHWDREGKNDPHSSCWVRVATQWAGKQWGMIHIPRIGQEVIVDFLEGDPDQPIIVGSVYNADMMPPYSLPANKTQSGIVSRSTLGGSPENFNEFCFEDKKGQELVYLRAEKDLTIAVENDEAHWVGHDRTKTIGHDETTYVEHDRTETVDNDETITIHGNRTETVNKNETITIALNRTETVGLNEAVTVGAAQAITVGAAQAITVGAARTVTVGAVQTYAFGASVMVSVSGSQTVKVDKERSVEVAKDESIKVGKKFSLEAADEIELKTGEASITMKKDGTIKIKGVGIDVVGDKKIKIFGAEVSVKGMATVDVSAPKVDASAAALMKISGGLVKIN